MVKEEVKIKNELNLPGLSNFVITCYYELVQGAHSLVENRRLVLDT